MRRLLLPLLFCLPLVCRPDGGTLPSSSVKVRIATFNVAMGLDSQGALAKALESGTDPRLRRLAAILQTVRPDILLLNEFDYDPEVGATRLLNDNYLANGRDGREPIRYPHHFRAPVNTGIDSGLDLDGDGRTGGPNDAWGFGHFPGQYGMLVLSKYPLRADETRTFQKFPWSAMPGALKPVNPDGSSYYSDETWFRLRLSSKSHWDLDFNIGGKELHLLAFHPTPPVFDGPDDHNGRRNSDEIRFWRDYTDPSGAEYIVDDQGATGGIGPGTPFVIAGDFNADPLDGDSRRGAVTQLLDAPWIDASCVPASAGAVAAAESQGGANRRQTGNPAADTSDFDDQRVGNLRLDYLLPSRGLQVTGCGVFWPAPGESGHDLESVSDHRLVWLDIRL